MAQDLEQARVFTTPVHEDARGYFAESWNTGWDLGLSLDIKQTNICWTEHAQTLRGLHAQHGAGSVAKLVRVIRGEILDVYVDARRDSPDFGVWRACTLSQVGQAIYVPRGFYHGYVTLTADVLVTYHQDAVYDAQYECGLNYLNASPSFWSSLNIDPVQLRVSDKDRLQPRWSEAVKF